MDDWFYSFLTALWVVFNSNFWAALAGAFAGAVAASKFALVSRSAMTSFAWSMKRMLQSRFPTVPERPIWHKRRV
jgi:hypothetical protein